MKLISNDRDDDEDNEPKGFVTLPVIGDVVSVDEIAMVRVVPLGSGETPKVEVHLKGGAVLSIDAPHNRAAVETRKSIISLMYDAQNPMRQWRRKALKRLERDPVPEPPRYPTTWIRAGSEQWKAWCSYRAAEAAAGRWPAAAVELPTDNDGGWYVESEWPPNHPQSP
jgi:hypothetical protein